MRLYEVLPALTGFYTSVGNYRSDTVHPVIYRVKFVWFRARSRHETAVTRRKTTMIAWEPMTSDETSLQKPAMSHPANLMYRLALAFPSWAGALLVIYAIFVTKFLPKLDTLRIRPR